MQKVVIDQAVLMHTLLFCFANNRDQPLDFLKEEDEGIDRLLDARSSRLHFLKVRDSFATTRSLAEKILTYQETLTIFHYSGHAGQTLLQLEDATARGAGIAQLLGRCPNLRLVFLNGCSTLQHIRLLAEQNIDAAVIATSAPVNDQVASFFSLAFYRALVQQYSLQEAIEQARLQLQVRENIHLSDFSRGALETQEELTRNHWYFHCPDPQVGQWELPSHPEQAAGYVPNKLLRQVLFDTLRKADPALTSQYLARKELPPEALKNWVNEELLLRFPYPLAEPLRRLLCPVITPDGRLLPVAASLERLQQYLALVESHLDLTMSTLLAQIRNLLLGGKRPPERTDSGFLRDLLTEGWAMLPPERVADLSGSLLHMLAERDEPPFIEEISDLIADLKASPSLMEALGFFEELRRRLAAPGGPANVPGLCRIGEDHLTELFKRLGFWAGYRLESYKNIRVIRFYDRTPQYRHEKVVLRSQSYRLNEEQYFREVVQSDLWECQSVLLVRNRRRAGADGATDEPEENRFLNLSPFIIDRNVYKKSDNSVFDLFSFRECRPDRMLFSHIARPHDPPLSISMKKEDAFQREDYSLLREQMEVIGALAGLDLPVHHPSDEAPEIDLSLL
ncbi:hypothetical protein [Larkinella soli]|uniref:hypothetical protein n=1 Tax=Larkinella soli TaxID=1770527 RepID=UPI0019D15505|nr:hypothetical protein [Larkinella soli]